MKSFMEMTDQEKIQSCDRMLNVLLHPDWQEVYFTFSDAAKNFRQEMENAPDWESFVSARAKYEYIRDVILKLPDNIKTMRDELSTEPTHELYED
jgi:hypothetical protein